MKSIIINSVCLSFVLFSFGQTIEKSSIDSGGASSTNSSLQVLFTIGEVAVNEVNTSSLSVSEGFIGPLGTCNVVISQSAENLELFFDGNSNTAEVDIWLNNNGNAIANSACGDITWTYEIINDFLEDTNFDFVDDQLTIEIEFTATDTEGNLATTSAFIIFDDFATAGESAGNGGTICEDTFPVSDFDNDLFFDSDGVDYNDAKFNSSSFQLVQTGGKPGLQLEGTDVKFPDTGAGQFTYNFDFKVQTTVTIGNKPSRNYETTTFYTANNVTVAFDPGPDISITECDASFYTLTDLYDLLAINIGIVTEDNPFNDADVSGFNPDDYWLDTFGSPITEAGDFGTYIFDAGAFLPECDAIPVSVTIDPEPFPSAGSDIFEQENCYSQTTVILDDYLSINADSGGFWNSLDGLTIIDNREVVFPDTGAGQITYEFTYTAQNACGDEDISIISIDVDIPPSVSAGLGGDNDTSSQATINLNDFLTPDATPGGTWSGELTVEPDGTVQFPDTGAGQFSFSFFYTVENGCGLSEEAEYIFTINEAPDPVFAGEDGFLTICPGDTFTTIDLFNALGGDPDSGGSWDPLPNGQGVYTYTVDNGFETDTSTVTVEEILCPQLVDISIKLQGPSTNPNIGEEALMRDDLRVNGLISTISPYVDALTCDASVFDLSGPDAIVDWIWVELRDGTDSSVVVASTSAFLQRDGNVVGVDGTTLIAFDVPENDYYISVSHRNHLGILSAQPLTLSQGSTASIDFTTDISLIDGGSNAIATLPDGTLALYSGDFNGDGQVQNTDRLAVEALRGINGYDNADLDGNGEVQNTDLNISLIPNIGKGIQFLGKQLHAKRRTN